MLLNWIVLFRRGLVLTALRSAFAAFGATDFA